MSIEYVGNAENVTLNAPVNITTSQDATPINVTTATPHGLLDNEIVEITDHEVNVAANRTWRVLVISATVITLVGSVGSGAGAGTATGTVTAITPRPDYVNPDDGDPAAASSWDVPYENLQDKDSYLAARCGALCIAQLKSTGTADDTDASWSNPSTTAGVWAESNANAAGATGPGNGFTGLAANVLCSVTYGTRDYIDVHFDTHIIVGGTSIAYSLFLDLYDPGVASSFATATQLTGSFYKPPASFNGQLRLRGFRNISAGTRGKKARVYLAHKEAGGAATYNMLGHRQIIVEVKRNTRVMP